MPEEQEKPDKPDTDKPDKPEKTDFEKGVQSATRKDVGDQHVEPEAKAAKSEVDKELDAQRGTPPAQSPTPPKN